MKCLDHIENRIGPKAMEANGDESLNGKPKNVFGNLHSQIVECNTNVSQTLGISVTSNSLTLRVKGIGGFERNRGPNYICPT
jgi:hypothetical protein